MKSIYITSDQEIIINEAMNRHLERKLKVFKKRKNTHFNNAKLKTIMGKINCDISIKLYDIPFNCFFSIYLYLLLKSKVKFMDWCEMPYYYRIAVTQDFNINRLSKETGICRNTIRKAFQELVKFKLVEITDYVEPDHKATKPCLVFNDYYIHSFDYDLGHVVYSSDIPFNFYNQ